MPPDRDPTSNGPKRKLPFRCAHHPRRISPFGVLCLSSFGCYPILPFVSLRSRSLSALPQLFYNSRAMSLWLLFIAFLSGTFPLTGFRCFALSLCFFFFFFFDVPPAVVSAFVGFFFGVPAFYLRPQTQTKPQPAYAVLRVSSCSSVPSSAPVVWL